LPRVKMTLCNMAVTEPRVTIMTGVIFSFSIWSPYFTLQKNRYYQWSKSVEN